MLKCSICRLYDGGGRNWPNAVAAAAAAAAVTAAITARCLLHCSQELVQKEKC